MPLLRHASLVVITLIATTACAPDELVPTEPMALDGTSLTVEALPQERCDPDDFYAVRVRWKVTDWGQPRFDFHLDSTKGKLWARENRTEGEKDSTAFVRPGMFFVLVDRNSRMMVAATPAPPLVCPSPD